MTGYGFAEVINEQVKIALEIKSVNHRFLDFSLRLPRGFAELEEPLKAVVRGYLARGRVDILVNIEDLRERKRQLKVDRALAIDYYNSLKEIADSLGICADLKVDVLTGLPQIWELAPQEQNAQEYWPLLEEAALKALQGLAEMRRREGERLAQDLKQRARGIHFLVEEIESRSPLVVDEYRRRLRERMDNLLPGGIEESRLIQEVAIYADRSSITEEVVRLKSHLNVLGELLEADDEVGRKLDFLVQEMHREINTIGSKSSDLEISTKVVEVKSEIEKIREQVQNLE